MMGIELAMQPLRLASGWSSWERIDISSQASEIYETVERLKLSDGIAVVWLEYAIEIVEADCRLQKLLQESAYLDEVCTTVDKVREHDQKCSACRFFLYCAGGCRAIALALTGDKLAADPSKCIFFTGGYYEKALKAMEGYHNLSPMQL